MIFNYIKNINLIISNNNIYSLSYLTIFKNTNKDNLVFYYINNINFIKYLYILYSFFFNLKIIYIDYFPYNDIDNIMYISKLFKLNIDIKLIDNFNDISSNKLNIDYNNLIPDQLYFFEKIKEASIEYKNNEINIENLSFIKGLKVYFNEHNFNDNILWDISFYGETSIDLFIKEGKKI